MNAALQQALECLDQEIEAVDQQRADLIGAREHLAKVAGSVGVPSSTKKKPERAVAKRGKARASVPDDGEVLGVVDELKGKVLALLKRGQGLSPKDCRDASGATASSMKKAIESLAKAKAIVVVGKHRAQKLYSPGKAPAKEAL
jgi:predicted HTH transcriptional regulator